MIELTLLAQEVRQWIDNVQGQIYNKYKDYYNSIGETPPAWFAIVASQARTRIISIAVDMLRDHDAEGRYIENLYSAMRGTLTPGQQESANEMHLDLMRDYVFHLTANTSYYRRDGCWVSMPPETPPHERQEAFNKHLTTAIVKGIVKGRRSFHLLPPYEVIHNDEEKLNNTLNYLSATIGAGDMMDIWVCFDLVFGNTIRAPLMEYLLAAEKEEEADDE